MDTEKNTSLRSALKKTLIILVLFFRLYNGTFLFVLFFRFFF